MKIINSFKKNYIFFVCYLTVLIGFYFNEDALGGAKTDYLFHIEFIELFYKDLIYGIKNYGYDAYIARNSPVFYIILSFLNKLLSLDLIRLFNTVASLILAIIFYKCLRLNFNFVKREKLKILSCIVFLSPTVRSLSIWPYPLLWGLIFFLVSIFYFLKFLKLDNKKENYFFLSIFFLAISSYLHINFCVFGIFFLFNYFKYKKFDYITFYLAIYIVFLAIPALLFIFFREGIYLFNAEGLPVTFFDILNFSNKIMIISTIFTFYLIPIIDYRLLFSKLKKLNFKNILVIIFLYFLIIYNFDYPYTNSFGGGFFFKLSNLLFNNNLFFYIIFFISLFVFYILFENIKSNYLLSLILVLYNLQFTIYNKYFDPLLIIISLLIFDIKIQEYFFKQINYLKKIYFFLFIFYLIYHTKGLFI
tara:strand:+ start:673 stop:1926 length:1254 start_codon:yes stop_codon:yes gene_type:complete